MIVYVGISKKPNGKKSLELITVFSNVAGYKIYIEINYINYILTTNTRTPKLKYKAVYNL